MRKEINPAELDFLLRFPAAVNVTTPVDFLSNHSWGGIKVGIPNPTHPLPYVLSTFSPKDVPYISMSPSTSLCPFVRRNCLSFFLTKEPH